MIEVIVQSRCDGCNRCVEVCPGNVFDISAEGHPVIARQVDCQSCYQCELYCTADALYVGHDCERPLGIDEVQALASGTLGQYRRHSGWDEWAGTYSNQQWRMGQVFRRAAGFRSGTIDGLGKP
ncbi:ferredoxin family protein [Pseudomonas sp. ABC1]|uniref:4Fe-4S dicluster domain-containing protein n=1 Tax=Pseudomonas sp. ABC1 TaxID=2748080 RepID=UPI0015C2EFD8|nr:ferredoxin family protein [Pseudomonas sp. ABC1]QLF94685.1 ferredoxin family protein [Pseudomonas sp. ABC1]